MHPMFKAVCSAVIFFETLAVLWLAKLLGQQEGIDTFWDGLNAFIDTMTNW